MGFEGKKIIRLRFEGDLEGLEVTTRCPTIEQVMDVAENTPDDDAKAALRATATLLCDVLIEWNLENDGEPVPHTAEDLLDQDMDVAQAIVKAWEDAAIKVSPNLRRRSSDGSPLAVASIPMEPLSPSLAS